MTAIRRTAAAWAVLAAIACPARPAVPLPAQTPARDLFLPAAEALPPVDPTQEIGVSRERAAGVRRDVLAPGAAVRFNLFADAVCVGVIDSATPNPATHSISYRGHLQDDPLGSVSLVCRDDAFEGLIQREGVALYRIATLPGGLVRVQQVDGAALPPCANAPARGVAPPPAFGSPAPAGDAPSARTGPVIDVMVVYTPAAMNAAGGAAAIEARAQLSVDVSDQAYENSGISASLRLVHVQGVVYAESGGFDGMLRDLTGAKDGRMDDVHAWRDQWGADLVSLFVVDGSYCGMAWQMTTTTSGFASSAFSVCNYVCASSDYTLAHEMGHNEGCGHDRENAGMQLTDHSYGWRFSGDSGRLFRTVMAYAPGARVPYFSSPTALYDGQPTGVPIGEANQSDNASTVSSTAPTVAAFRASTSAPDIEPAGAEVVAQGATVEPAIEPGATVTVAMSLRNVSSADADDVTATLLTSGGVTPVSKSQQRYGDLAGGAAAVAREFQLVATGPCGSMAVATLSLQSRTGDLGTVAFPLRLGAPSASHAVYSMSGGPVPVPDEGSLASSVVVPSRGPVSSVRVGVRIQHTYDRDLDLALTGPDGTRVLLSAGNGSGEDNYGAGSADCAGTLTVFDDTAGTAITSGLAPFVGTYRPQEALAAFAGRPADGTWTLTVADRAAGDTGVLCCWTLDLQSTVYTCGPPPSLADAALALRASGGIQALTPAEFLRLSPDAAPMDAAAAARIARQALGLDG